MAKDPAFLFYSADFLAGVQDLTMEERGQYITILCLQHQKGHLSEKMISLCLGEIKPDVLAKLTKDGDGLLFNRRLEEEINKRKKYYQSQSEKASKRWKKTNAVVDAAAYTVALPVDIPRYMPTENDNVIGNLGKEGGMGEGKEYPIETCKDFALKDTRWMSKNRITASNLDEFNDFLERGGTFYKVPKEYKEHFRNWKAKKPAVVEMKPIKNKLDELKERFKTSS